MTPAVQNALVALIQALQAPETPTQDRACSAVDIVYPLVAEVLTDHERTNELVFRIVRALTEKGAL